MLSGDDRYREQQAYRRNYAKPRHLVVMLASQAAEEARTMSKLSTPAVDFSQMLEACVSESHTHGRFRSHTAPATVVPSKIPLRPKVTLVGFTLYFCVTRNPRIDNLPTQVKY